MIRSNGIMILALLVIATVAVFVYSGRRNAATQNMEQQTRKLSDEKAKMQEYERKAALYDKSNFLKPDTAAFIEGLYICAQNAGVKGHEAVTASGRDNIVQVRQAAEKGGGSKKQLIKVSLEGGYRESAEYVREMQNMEMLKKVTVLEMKPAGGSIRTNITVELMLPER